MPAPTLSRREVRRLALTRAGLLKPEWTGLPADVPARGGSLEARARAAAATVVRRFGYLQLDTVSIAGARSHAIVLSSRLARFPARLGEELLRPGSPFFEYWGHEVSWMPFDLYPVFAFRRRAFRKHPWWGDVIGKNRGLVRLVRRRIREEGPLRVSDLEGRGSRGWWDHKPAKRVAEALWTSGELAIRERKSFLRIYDLTERVVPDEWREPKVSARDAIRTLAARALEGHGFATTGTIAATWRLSAGREELKSGLDSLVAEGTVQSATLAGPDGRKTRGWILSSDLELLPRLVRLRPRDDTGVLLSPFDPVLWDRARVKKLFDFDQILEIFKPAAKRIYGYYCLPVLAGDRLVARYDLKADRKAGRLHVLSVRYEDETVATKEAARVALERYAQSVELGVKQG